MNTNDGGRTFQDEKRRYEEEVRETAARLIRIGECGPWQALDKAREIVQQRRQADAMIAEREAGR